MLQKTQSGRSMLEMIAVLAISGLLIVGGIFLFAHLFKYYQDNETTKEMNELITRYRSDRLTRRRNGSVVIKDLIPEARTKKSDTMITANNGSLQLEDNGDKGTFVIIGKDLGFSCQDILLQGNYDGVLDEGEEVLSPNDIKQKNIEQLKALCQREEVKFLFNRDGEKCNYYVNGACSDCKSGEVMALLPEGGNGCCRTGSMNECGYCEKCPDNKKCNKETKKCVECIDNNDCPGKQVCDEGVCVDCTQDSDCQTADMHCSSLKKCEKCDSRFQEWVNGICVCKKIRSKLNEACSTECGCAEGQCENGRCVETRCTEPKTHWDGTKCVCPNNQVYDAVNNECIDNPNDACPTPLLGKGTSCSDYNGLDNNCCGVGLSCRNGKCQCSTIPTTYGAECSVECGCASNTDLVCNDSNKCQCPSPKIWNGTKCVCPEPNNANSDKDCYEKYYPNTTVCPNYYYYRPKAEGTRCSGACHSCDSSGNCVDRAQSWTGRIWNSSNTNCCLASSTYTYCALNGETAPTACSANKSTTTTSNSVCQIATTTDLCTNTVLSTTYPNNGASCGECGGRCVNGTCNDNSKQSYTYNKLVNGVCTSVTESFCPANAPTDQCTLTKTCSGCNECQKCNTSTGQCEADTSKTSCGTCGTCNNGTCNDNGKRSYTYTKLVNDVCISVTEEFCPANAPSDQCILTKTCSGCNECQKCNTDTGKCVLRNSSYTVACSDFCCPTGYSCAANRTCTITHYNNGGGGSGGGTDNCTSKGYTMTSCPYCTECDTCTSGGVTRYKKKWCKTTGNCCTKNGSCVNCGNGGILSPIYDPT